MAADTHEPRQGGPASAVRMLAYMLFGPIVWALHLTAVYGSHALLCARGATQAVLGLSLPAFAVLAATAAALALLVVAIFAPGALRRIARIPDSDGRERGFQDRLAALLAVLSAFGVIWAGATALLLPACLLLR